MKFQPIHALMLLVWMIQFPVSAPAAEVATQKKVLVLYWYGKDFPANVDFDRGVQAVLQQERIQYYAEYYEPNRFPGEVQEFALCDYLRRKYSDRKIDVIIAMSRVSADFLLKYRDDLFPDVPIVFHTFNRAQIRQRVAGNPAGVVADNSQARTLDVALRFHPATEHVFVINGTIERDKTVETFMKDQLREFEDKVTITYFTDLPLNELIARVKTLPERSLIFYTRQDYEEPRRSLSQYDVLVLIASSANVPIYSSGGYVGYGTVGGYAVNTYECGLKAADMALRITDGSSPEDLAVVEVPSIPVFDWRQLRRWKLSEENVPPGSEIRFREPTLFEQYKWHIIGALTICAVQSLLIACLLAEQRRRRLAQERYKLATSSGGVIVWDANLTTSELYADPSLKSLLGYEDHEIRNHFGDCLRLVHPEDVNFVVERAKAHIHSITSRFEAEHRVVQKDGGIRWFLSSGTVVRNEQGKAVRMIGTGTDITQRKLTEQELQRLSARLLDAQDEERRRIARELHDGTAQNLLAIALNLENLDLRVGLPDEFHHALLDCETLCEQSLQEIRTLSYMLHPPMLDQAGLIAALRRFVGGFTKRTGIDVELVANQDVGRLPPEIEIALFRVAQECLANIHRHSGSHTAQIRMERQANEVILRIQDQGRGIPATILRSESDESGSFGVGLSGMRQRLRHLGGRLEIASSIDGTTITAAIPLAAETRDLEKLNAAHS
jgi:PAS domain S-box-containing protein